VVRFAHPCANLTDSLLANSHYPIS
jgi:hypothetical protein